MSLICEPSCAASKADDTSVSITAGIRNNGNTTSKSLRLLLVLAASPDSNDLAIVAMLHIDPILGLGTAAHKARSTGFAFPSTQGNTHLDKSGKSHPLLLLQEFATPTQNGQMLTPEWFTIDMVRLSPTLALASPPAGGESLNGLHLVGDPRVTITGTGSTAMATVTIPKLVNGDTQSHTLTSVRLYHSSSRSYFGSDLWSGFNKAITLTLEAGASRDNYVVTGSFTAHGDIDRSSQSGSTDNSEDPLHYTHLALYNNDATPSPVLWVTIDNRSGTALPDTSFAGASIDFLADSDSDGATDYSEGLLGTDPAMASSKPGTTNIDIMVLYTSTVSQLLSGEPQSTIVQHVEWANSALQASGIDARFRVVKYKEVDYSQSDYPQVLSAMRNQQSPFVGIDAEREAASADMLVLYSLPYRTENSVICGRALVTGLDREGDMALNSRREIVSVVGYSCHASTLAHELGHNLGLGHSAEQLDVGTWEWSRGHGVVNEFVTIMGYPRFFSVTDQRTRAVFSTPLVTDCGRGRNLACGVARAQSNGADAALSIKATMHQIAQLTSEPLDTDGDGMIDVLDDDDDNDGLTDEREEELGTNPLLEDTDGDTLKDGDEVTAGTDPLKRDSDNDGVDDNIDAFPKDPSETADSDDDGVGDNADAFPNDPNETEDSDGDMVGDNSDAFPDDPTESVDADKDGVGANTDANDNDASITWTVTRLTLTADATLDANLIATFDGFTEGPAAIRDGGCKPSASYRASFSSLWRANSHGSTPPGSAHFTSLVGATHNSQVSFWRRGGLATTGVERVAETGSSSTFSSTDVTNARAAGNAGTFINLGGLGAYPSSTNNNFTATADLPLLSLISMIAPTPDWFVGVSSLPLKQGSIGCWQPSITLQLPGNDAGTEQDTGFTLGNPAESPHKPIGPITFLPEAVRETPFASLVLLLQSTSGSADKYSVTGVFADSSLSSWNDFDSEADAARAGPASVSTWQIGATADAAATGTLKIKGVALTGDYLNFLMVGGNGSVDVGVKVLMAGTTTVLAEYQPNACADKYIKGDSHWRHVDVSSLGSQSVDIEFFDNEATNACGFVAFDHLYQSDTARGILAATASSEQDTDGDGTPDSRDAFPSDPTETADTDGDGTGDNSDVLPNDASVSWTRTLVTVHPEGTVAANIIATFDDTTETPADILSDATGKYSLRKLSGNLVQVDNEFARNSSWNLHDGQPGVARVGAASVATCFLILAKTDGCSTSANSHPLNSGYMEVAGVKINNVRIHKTYLTFLMAGGDRDRDVGIKLFAAGTDNELATWKPTDRDNFIKGDQHWRRIDVSAAQGRQVDIEVFDNDRGPFHGHIAFDHFYQGNAATGELVATASPIAIESDLNLACPCEADKTAGQGSVTLTAGAINLSDEASNPIRLLLVAQAEPASSTGVTLATQSLAALAASGTSGDRLAIGTEHTASFTFPGASYFNADGQTHLHIVLQEEETPGDWQERDRERLGPTLAMTTGAAGAFAVDSIDFLTDTDNDGVPDYSETLIGTSPTVAGTHARLTLDMMVLYTSAMATVNSGDPLTLINHEIEWANTSLTNSGINARFRLAAVKEVSYDETDQSFQEAIDAMGEQTGAFAGIDAERAAAGADLLVLYTGGLDSRRVCGQAALGGPAREGDMAGNPRSYIRAVLTGGNECGSGTLAHELGHNLGLGHSVKSRLNGTWPWAQGHGVLDSFSTVMAYSFDFASPGTSPEDRLMNIEIQRFSDPDVSTCKGQVCGVAINGASRSNKTAGANSVMAIKATMYQLAQLSDDPLDTDGDDLVNLLDPDDDNDGLTDAEEATGNTNPLIADTDGDGLTDGAEVNTHSTNPLVADSDGDGLNDGAEVNTHSTNPLLADSDGDGLNDGAEVNTHSTNPLVADSDSDGLNDGAEVNTHSTNPLVADSDGDGVNDNIDVFPNDRSETLDTDGDGVGDNADAFPSDPSETADTDDDGVGDNADAFPSDPTETADADSDGTGDNSDARPNDASVTWTRTRLTVTAETALAANIIATFDDTTQGPAAIRASSCPASASYQSTFTSQWSANSHGSTPPGSAHFTSLVGATHNSQVVFWERGGLATPGVEGVAEFGSTGTFSGTDVANARAAGNAGAFLNLGSLGRYPSTTSRTFTATADFPLLTVISMIAPTPDWFVGVSGLSLKDANGCWRSSIAMPLVGYDAGTETGTRFSLSNPAESPHKPIGPITALPQSVRQVPFASLTLILQSPAGNIDKYSLTGIFADASLASWNDFESAADAARLGAASVSTWQIGSTADAAATGTLKVKNVTLTGDYLNFLMAGGNGTVDVGVKVLAAGTATVLAEFKPNACTDKYLKGDRHWRHFNVSRLGGQSVDIEFFDNEGTDACGFITFDHLYQSDTARGWLTTATVPDTDGDGTPNDQDAFPSNPSESLDTDGDMIGNNADPDDDNDGLTDAEEATLNTNPLLADTDGDTVNDRLDIAPRNPAIAYETMFERRARNNIRQTGTGIPLHADGRDGLKVVADFDDPVAMQKDTGNFTLTGVFLRTDLAEGDGWNFFETQDRKVEAMSSSSSSQQSSNLPAASPQALPPQASEQQAPPKPQQPEGGSSQNNPFAPRPAPASP